MKRTTKTSALLLAFLLLAGCAQETSDVKQDSTGEGAADQTITAETSMESEEAETERTPALPDDLSFHGETFRFLSRHESSGTWTVLDAYTEGTNGEVLNDAIYQRNDEVMERLDVVIEQTPSSNVPNDVKAAVMSGDNSFDALLMNAVGSFSMASGELLTDLREIPYVDLDNPWWDSGANETLALYGHQYYAVSDMNLMANEATWITMANKTVLDDLGIGLDSLYDKVREGVWTIDAYRAVSEPFYRDVNNNGKTDSEDWYGTVMQGHGADGFLMGLGMRWVEKDEDGEPVLIPLDDRTVSIFDKVGAVVNNKVAFNSHDSKQNDKFSQNTEFGQQIFAENRAIFFTETLQCVRRLRTMDTDFGVLPMPKYDETQETYISMTHWWAMSALSLPLNLPNPEKSGAVLEYMSYLSTKEIKDVYFDVAINGKYLRDEQSIEMMEYVMQKRVIDLAYAMFHDGSLPGKIRDMLYEGGTDYASTYAQNGKLVDRYMEKLLSPIRGS